VFSNRFSAWERSVVAEERKYCPSEIDHGGKLKELAGSFRLAGERRFRCVVTNCTNNTRAFSDVENESRIVPRFFRGFEVSCNRLRQRLDWHLYRFKNK